MSKRPLVLDTHAWIWIVNGNDEIKPSLQRAVVSALTSQAVLVPAVCVWEVGMLWQRNRIQLGQPITAWVSQALEKPGFTLAPLTVAIALESVALPGDFQSDPADCMIVATARVENAVLVTRDSRMQEYAKKGHVNVLPI